MSDIGVEPDAETQDKYIEDVAATVDYIRTLPTRDIRGLSLHCNDSGYFVVWPDASYYKFRSFSVEADRGKYRNPSGVKQTPLAPTIRGGRAAIVVEGEINALSLDLVAADTVVSPGGVGTFVSPDLLTFLKPYDTIYIVADKDDPGAKAAIKLRMHLVGMGKHKVFIDLWEPDANDILVKHGKEALAEKVRQMGLQVRV